MPKKPFISRMFALVFLLAACSFAGEDYKIEAIRYATISQFPIANLVMGAPEGEKLDIAMVVWLIRGRERTILFDSGFYRESWMERFNIVDFLSPEKAVALAGVEPGDVTDVIISHAHWDHMGGIDLFPNATVWIQKEEFEYYVGAAWQQSGRHGGIDPEDLVSLLRCNMEGQTETRRW
ncbi:MBL fold metallo-hydrolase [bacterium]|nr:MBL fold metallo-hydrolase [bacterium]